MSNTLSPKKDLLQTLNRAPQPLRIPSGWPTKFGIVSTRLFLLASQACAMMTAPSSHAFGKRNRVSQMS
eukprot:3289848-Amphidinium_carterae.1